MNRNFPTIPQKFRGYALVVIGISSTIWGLTKMDGPLQIVGFLAFMGMGAAIHLYTWKKEQNPFNVAARKLSGRPKRMP
jgi:hypothetical protein